LPPPRALNRLPASHATHAATRFADVCVVGGGIVGLTAAYHLALAGKSVVLLERNQVVSGVSGKTTAKVTLQHGLYYDGLVKRYGRKRAMLHVEANTAGAQAIESLQASLGADASYTKAPSYVYTEDPKQVGQLEAEAATCRDLGLPASFTTETELPFAVAGAVRFEGQAHFHPRKYLLALAQAAERLGVVIHEGTHVTGLDDGEPCKVSTDRGDVRAKHVVVATNVPINERSFYVMRMQVKREYAAAGRATGRRIEGMYVNCDEPRRSVRPYAGEAGMLVFSGESHHVAKHQETEGHYEALAEFSGTFGVQELEYRWSTQDYYPIDEVPMVGRYGPTTRHTYTATGFRAWGMTMGTAAGLMLTDLVVKGSSPWSDLYDPFTAARLLKPLARPDTYHLVGTAVEGLVGRRLKPYGAGDLEPGEGRVMDAGMHKVAVCRDRQGQLHSVMAKCSHMGCIVSWNTAEQSWDCPCHGSRFSPAGEVLRGPATKPLEPAKEPDAVSRRE
jgi:glycine/D-amino acid oxidase-like deaminating enzyme/nitrite reductase/ring-hydroxylating ferredoxin subunit